MTVFMLPDVITGTIQRPFADRGHRFCSRGTEMRVYGRFAYIPARPFGAESTSLGVIRYIALKEPQESTLYSVIL